MTPLIRIEADGADVTDRLRDRLIDLRLHDAAGYKADTLTMTLDDRDGVLVVPPSQSTVTVSLGLLGARAVPLTRMGSFLIDEVQLTGPERRMILSGSAAAMGTDIRAPRTRAWEGVTLGAMVATIAEEAGLTPSVDPELAGLALPFVAQTAESNLHILTRVARQIGAVFKPADGHLLVARRGADTNAAGQPLPVLRLLPSELTSWSWRAAERDRYASAEASWTDLATGQVTRVVVGDGTPRRVLRHVYRSEDEARRSAQAALNGAGQGAETARLQCAGFRPDAFAGARLRFADTRPEWAGDWSVTAATHVLNATLTTDLELERPLPKGA
ncbi:contractile injection system protein, VgrG/Pvc8 family [Fluviibacterium sp. DFM31]|uniref:Contractile injection system protein, VgrG/Pvc8 family n=1 Tax=Meridianimarinicoccus marinus TaxID=3231483 RepID=A0ABV3L6W2_9RHOB